MNERWQQRRQWLAIRLVEGEFTADQRRPGASSAKVNCIA
jgi:hypothetical protein